MNAEFTYFASAFVALFVIVDPFGLVPFYLALTARFNQEDRRIGLNLITRLMGILITAVAVQFILNGIEEALKAGGFL